MTSSASGDLHTHIAFLDTFVFTLDGVFPLFGTVAFAVFCFYLMVSTQDCKSCHGAICLRALHNQQSTPLALPQKLLQNAAYLA